jgi:hypothetical protein
MKFVCFFFQFCWVSWDDAIVVSASKLGKLWDSLSELRSSLCERRQEKTVLKPALLPVKTAQFTQFFRQVWRHTVKSFSLTERALTAWGRNAFPKVCRWSTLMTYNLGIWAIDDAVNSYDYTTSASYEWIWSIGGMMNESMVFWFEAFWARCT